MKLKKVFIMILALLGFIALQLYFPAWGQQCIPPIIIDKPQVAPPAFLVGRPTVLTATVHVAVNPNLLPNSVNLIRVDDQGKAIAVLTWMYDDGTHGDAFPEDGKFTAQITLNEPTPGNVNLAVMAACKGALLRTKSPNAIVTVEALEPIEQVNGIIWDVELYRILFLDNSEGKPQLKIHYRTSGEDIVIPSADGRDPSYGYLSFGGAVFVAGEVLEARVYEWKNGVLHFLGYPDSALSLKVSKGTKRYVIWNGGLNDFFEGLLILRDLKSGTNTVVSADNVGNWFNDVTNGGEVVYWIGAGWSGPGDTTYDYNILRYRDGVTIRLTNDQYFWNTYPLTDGINVVYRKHDPCCNGQQYQITMYNDELGEEILRPMGEHEPSPGYDFQPRGGWVAFTKPGDGGLQQIWVRSPSGEKSQISNFNTSSYIDTLAPNGEVTFFAYGRRYLGTRDTNPIDIGPSNGKSLWLKGKWYVYIRGTLYQVVR